MPCTPLFSVFSSLVNFHYRTWGFLVDMVGGIVLEIVVYIGRIQMHYSPFIEGPFLMSLQNFLDNVL
jgi:hypothetical protein